MVSAAGTCLVITCVRILTSYTCLKRICSADFLSSKNVTALRCIRHRDIINQQYERMVFFGPMCASDRDFASHGAAPFLEWAAEFNDRLLEDLQRQQAESLLPDIPNQMPSVSKISFREIL